MSLLERNLEALRAWTPATADAIATSVIPDGWTSATGTDGSPTYQRLHTTPSRRIEWLGGTSMPRSSAEPLIFSLDPGLTNGLALSIGTGFEWQYFAAKLSRPQALFVYEPDAALLRMALSICDLHDLLHTGKILLVTGNAAQAGNELAAFLARHPGYDPPTVLHPLATLPNDRRNLLIADGEAIVRRAAAAHQAQTSALISQLEQVASQQTDAEIAFTTTPRYLGERPLQQALSPSIPTLCIDHHASSSLAARIQMIVTHRPRKILSDLFRPQLACVPPAVVVETWIPPLVGPAYWNRLPAPYDLRPHDRIVVHAGAHEARLMEHGIPRGQIELRPVRPLPATASTPSSPHRIVLIGDLVPLDPASLSIQLPTHLAVFAEARRIIEAEYLTVHVSAAADVLRRALVRAGVSIGPDGATDPALRDPMFKVVRDVLLPTLPLLVLAETLLAQNIPLRLIGDWTVLTAPASDRVVLDPFTPWTDRESLPANCWEDAALLVHLSPTGAVSPLMWNAVQAHVPILAPQHATDAFGGSLATLLKPNVEYAQTSPQQFVNSLKSLLRDAPRRQKLADAAFAKSRV